MYTKEQIIDEIKRVAEQLGVKYLEQEDFEKNSTITMNTVRYFLGTWKQAIDVTGLEAPDAGKKLDDVDEEDLLLDLIRLYKEFGETPSLMLIKKNGKYHERLYAAKWNTVSDAFRRARRKYPHKLVTPSPSMKKEINYDEKLDEVLDDYEETDEIKKEDLLKGKDPMDFKGLLYEGEGDNTSTGEKSAPSKKKPPKKEPQKKKDDSPKPEELGVDPNEITQVHSAKKLLEMAPPIENKKEKEKEKERESGKDPLDFSDIGLDVVNVNTGNDDDDQEPVSDKTIMIDQDGKTPPPPASFKTINFKEPSKFPESDKTGVLYIPETIKPKQNKKKKKSAAELLNFRGLRYAPINQQGVLFIFGMISHELGFMIESVKAGFPTSEGRRCVNREENEWEHVRLQLEYKSSYFREMGHDDNEIDLIVCWNHDWDDCPIEVLELRSIIKYLEDNNNS